MAKEVIRRRGTTAEHSTFTGAEGEITVDTTKDTLVIHDGSTAGGFPLAKEVNLNNKNVIINGNFDIWQRGTSFTGPTFYTVDRFRWARNGSGVVDHLQSTSVPNGTSASSLQIDVTTADASLAADDFYTLRYHVEGYDAMRFGLGTSDATNMTLSFWVRSAVTGIHCVAFRNWTGSEVNRSYIVEYTINSVDTWEFQTITIAGDTSGTWLTDNSKGLTIDWSLAMGSDRHGTANTWTATNNMSTSSQVNVMDPNGDGSASDNAFHLSQVQLELGSVATEFERRSFEQELAMAQRYYHLFGRGVGGLVASTTIILVGSIVSPTMRSSGTLSLETTTPQIRRTTGSVTGSGSALSSTNTNDNGFETRISGFTGLTAGHSIQIVTNDTLALDAEL